MSEAVTTPHSREPLSGEEEKSFTHSDFWIPEEERETYKLALRTLNEQGVPYVVTGAYAVYEYTGIYRETKDLDVFVAPPHLLPAMRALKSAGFTTRLEEVHWLAKAKQDPHFVDLIFGMGNGLALVDEDWYRYSKPAILAATPVRVAPAEELIWHRLFINERHRQDMADIVHLIFCLGGRLDWNRLLDKTGPHWSLLLAELQMFSYVYPEAQGCVPEWVLSTLLERAANDAERERTGERVTRGTLVSKFSFAIDVNDWGFRDLRTEAIEVTRKLPVLREIAMDPVWDERAESVQEFLQEKPGGAE